MLWHNAKMHCQRKTTSKSIMQIFKLLSHRSIADYIWKKSDSSVGRVSVKIMVFISFSKQDFIRHGGQKVRLCTPTSKIDRHFEGQSCTLFRWFGHGFKRHGLAERVLWYSCVMCLAQLQTTTLHGGNAKCKRSLFIISPYCQMKKVIILSEEPYVIDLWPWYLTLGLFDWGT